MLNQRQPNVNNRNLNNEPYPNAEKPFFTNGKLNLLWISDYAKTLSEKLEREGLSSTQLRNFYNEFLRIRNMPETSAEEKKIHIRLLVAKAEYKKTTNRITPIYVKFLTNLVKEIGDNIDRFEDACHIMEALVAYNPRNK